MKKQTAELTAFLNNVELSNKEKSEKICADQKAKLRFNDWCWCGVIVLIFSIFCYYQTVIKREYQEKYETMNTENKAFYQHRSDSLFQYCKDNIGITIDSTSMAKFMVKYSKH